MTLRGNAVNILGNDRYLLICRNDMKIPIYQVDAFAENVFSGNPAAVCPLGEWLPTETMQAIAEENNLSETAFFLPNGNSFDIRWFTPKAEIDLAGHPTLATAHANTELWHIIFMGTKIVGPISVT